MVKLSWLVGTSSLSGVTLPHPAPYSVVIPASHIFICFVLSSPEAREAVGKSVEVNLLLLVCIFAMWKYLSLSTTATGVAGLPVPPFLLLVAFSLQGHGGKPQLFLEGQ